ncbi:MAG: helix-turn-helix domain-containing protein [Microthrixaceae bacterium]|nr:helix-turn-helix domain-containing protein [Microthrixaceae bacterium]
MSLSRERKPGEPVRVGVLAYDGCYAAEIFGLTDLLRIANLVATGSGQPCPFAVEVLGATDTITAAGGFGLAPQRWHRRLDVLVVPGFELIPGIDVKPLLAERAAEVGFIRSLGTRGCTVASVCVGAYLVAAAGLLDGRRATTSWLFADDLAACTPTATITPDAMLVTDGSVTTSAAFSAVHDLAMDLVRRHGGESVARQTARITLVPDNRTSQAPYVDRRPANRPGLTDDVTNWLAERLADPYDLSRLAAAFHLSTRTLLRRFGAEAGTSPLVRLHDLRVARAQRLLESTDLSSDDVMRSVGYRDAGSFRRQFVTRVGITPAAYRRQFQGIAEN